MYVVSLQSDPRFGLLDPRYIPGERSEIYAAQATDEMRPARRRNQQEVVTPRPIETKNHQPSTTTQISFASVWCLGRGSKRHKMACLKWRQQFSRVRVRTGDSARASRGSERSRSWILHPEGSSALIAQFADHGKGRPDEPNEPRAPQ